MDSKNQIKRLQALKIKKYRIEKGEFFIEGAKIIHEALESKYEIRDLFLTEKALAGLSSDHPRITNTKIVSEKWISQAGNLKSNDFGIAVLKIPEEQEISKNVNTWSLLLDNISDPGNLGTIIRTADWYGIRSIICSSNTVDAYNPKVIMSSKGSFLRVRIDYLDLKKFLEYSEMEVYAADLEGKSIHEIKSLPKTGLLLLGSESHGISNDLKVFIKERIKIPGGENTESLNVAMANAIILDNFKRLGVI